MIVRACAAPYEYVFVARHNSLAPADSDLYRWMRKQAVLAKFCRKLYGPEPYVHNLPSRSYAFHSRTILVLETIQASIRMNGQTVDRLWGSGNDEIGFRRIDRDHGLWELGITGERANALCSWLTWCRSMDLVESTPGVFRRRTLVNRLVRLWGANAVVEFRDTTNRITLLISGSPREQRAAGLQETPYGWLRTDWLEDVADLRTIQQAYEIVRGSRSEVVSELSGAIVTQMKCELGVLVEKLKRFVERLHNGDKLKHQAAMKIVEEIGGLA